MTLIPLSFCLLSTIQLPPEDTSWGNPEGGVRLGLAVTAKSDGPPVLNCYLKNESNESAVYRPDDKRHAAVVPEYMLKSKEGVWFVTPPSTYPGLWDGPDYRQVYVPAHMTVMVNSSRFWFAVTAGKYTISATYDNVRLSGKSLEKKTSVRLDSGEATVNIAPGHVQPAMGAGIG